MKGMRKLSITATAMVAAAVMALAIQLVQFIQQFGKHLRHQNQ